jgi:hypothetical protein
MTHYETSIHTQPGYHNWKIGLDIDNACVGFHASYWDDIYFGARLATDPTVFVDHSNEFASCSQ